MYLLKHQARHDLKGGRFDAFRPDEPWSLVSTSPVAGGITLRCTWVDLDQLRWFTAKRVFSITSPRSSPTFTRRAARCAHPAVRIDPYCLRTNSAPSKPERTEYRLEVLSIAPQNLTRKSCIREAHGNCITIFGMYPCPANPTSSCTCDCGRGSIDRPLRVDTLSRAAKNWYLVGGREKAPRYGGRIRVCIHCSTGCHIRKRAVLGVDLQPSTDSYGDNVAHAHSCLIAIRL